MSYQLKPINEVHAFTEYQVRSSTSLFAIGFDYYEALDNILVQLNGTAIQDIDYTYELYNRQTLRITPAIQQGTLRISRETNVDQNKHTFSSGAIFNAANMDENFEQIRNAMQEIRDGFSYYSDRWLIKDTILEIQAGTSYAEPDLVFGMYTAVRDYTLLEFYPNLASTDTLADVSFVVKRNSDVVIEVRFSEGVPTINFLGGDVKVLRGDVITMQITNFHHTMNSVSGTFIAQYPILEVSPNADT